MAIYYDTITRWMNAEANSYPIAVNVLLETLITLLVQVIYAFLNTEMFTFIGVEL